MFEISTSLTDIPVLPSFGVCSIDGDIKLNINDDCWRSDDEDEDEDEDEDVDTNRLVDLSSSVPGEDDSVSEVLVFSNNRFAALYISISFLIVLRWKRVAKKEKK